MPPSHSVAVRRPAEPEIGVHRKVVCEASHFCMRMRGLEMQGARTVTRAILGEFRNHKATREEFLSLLSRRLRSR